MRFKTKKSRVILGILISVLGFRAWLSLKPDRFFADLGMNVPARFIVSHQSPFMLLTVNDKLILKIPTSQVATVQKVFAAQKDFDDASANLPRHYAEFHAGEEQFLPKSCPQTFQAGHFRAFDSTHGIYFCRFLFDLDDAKSTTLYLISVSPIN